MISLDTLEEYLLLIPEGIHPIFLFVVGATFGLMWTGFCHAYRYLITPTKRKRMPMQCYSTVCRRRISKGGKIPCYSTACPNKNHLLTRSKFKSA